MCIHSKTRHSTKARDPARDTFSSAASRRLMPEICASIWFYSSYPLHWPDVCESELGKTASRKWYWTEGKAKRMRFWCWRRTSRQAGKQAARRRRSVSVLSIGWSWAGRRMCPAPASHKWWKKGKEWSGRRRESVAEKAKLMILLGERKGERESEREGKRDNWLWRFTS